MENEFVFKSPIGLGDEVYYFLKYDGKPIFKVFLGHVQAVSFTSRGIRIKIREYHEHNKDFAFEKQVFVDAESAKKALDKLRDNHIGGK